MNILVRWLAVSHTLGSGCLLCALADIFMTLDFLYTCRKRVRINDATDLLTFDVSRCFIIASPQEERAKNELFVLLSGKKRRQSRAVAADPSVFCTQERRPAGFVDKVD